LRVNGGIVSATLWPVRSGYRRLLGLGDLGTLLNRLGRDDSRCVGGAAGLMKK
jgi:hypothetical protein